MAETQAPSFLQSAQVAPSGPSDGQPMPEMPAFSSLTSNPMQQPSAAPPEQFSYKPVKYEMSGDGVSSNDPALNNNSTIVNFITNQASPPRVYIHQYAWHYETRYRTVTRTDANGNRYTDTESYTQHVTDLNMYTDISRYVTNLYTLYNMENIDRYLVSTNKLRKITVKKLLANSLSNLCTAVYNLNRMKFEHYRVNVSLDNDEIKVFPDEGCSNCLRSRVTDVLCILSCMCIFYYPIKWCYEANFECHMVFQLSASEEQIFAENFSKLWVWGSRFGIAIPAVATVTMTTPLLQVGFQ